MGIFDAKNQLNSISNCGNTNFQIEFSYFSLNTDPEI